MNLNADYELDLLLGTVKKEEVKEEETFTTTYHSVEITVNKEEKTIEVEGLKLNAKLTAYEFLNKTEYGVSRYEVNSIINIEWEMNKSEKFIENLCKKLDKIATELNN